MLDRLPRINELQALIAKAPSYPITAQQMVALAIKEHARPAVIEFYRAFPDDMVFKNEEDLLGRSEQVAILDENMHDQPQEVLVAAEED